MIGNNPVRFAGSKRNLLAALASSAVFMSGCANMATTAPSLSPQTSGATFGGRIHGGNQPVGNAAVTLYYAGQNGFGSGDPNAGAGLGADARRSADARRESGAARMPCVSKGKRQRSS